jgi:transcription initiation factor TFIID subunit 2
MCFVEDMASDYSITAGLTICSTRLLFPENVLDPLETVPRLLTEALAGQYSGIALVAREPADAWLIAGMRTFMADSFMKSLAGNNEYRYRQKLDSDRVHALDRNRPALYGMGPILHLDPLETEFMTLKAGVVLFILDRRLTKSSGSAGISRIISRFLTTSKGGDADATFISTGMFHQRCQKMGHLPLDSFFEQWVYSAGCPTFLVTQRFNKKRMVVEMYIKQVQGEAQPAAEDLDQTMFLRDLKEEDAEVYAGQAPIAFVVSICRLVLVRRRLTRIGSHDYQDPRSRRHALRAYCGYQGG